MANYTYILPPVPTTSSVIGPTAGQIYFDMKTNRMKMYDGNAWVDLSVDLDDPMRIECEDRVLDGVNWYIVFPVGGIFSARQQWWTDAMDYCLNTFGEQNNLWVKDSPHVWMANNSKMWFKKERDRTLFVLKMA